MDVDSWRAAAAAAVSLRPIGEPRYVMHNTLLATSTVSQDKRATSTVPQDKRAASTVPQDKRAASIVPQAKPINAAESGSNHIADKALTEQSSQDDRLTFESSKCDTDHASDLDYIADNEFGDKEDIDNDDEERDKELVQEEQDTELVEEEHDEDWLVQSPPTNSENSDRGDVLMLKSCTDDGDRVSDSDSDFIVEDEIEDKEESDSDDEEEHDEELVQSPPTNSEYSDKGDVLMLTSGTDDGDHVLDSDSDFIVEDEIEDKEDSDSDDEEEHDEELVPSPPKRSASASQVARVPRLKPYTTSRSWAIVESETNQRVDRYGLVVVLRDKVDRHASWLACKLCAAFGCENEPGGGVEVKMFPRPFVEQQLISHVTTHHPLVWARFEWLNADRKQAMFEGRQWCMTLEELQQRARAKELNIKPAKQASKQGLLDRRARRKQKQHADRERRRQLRDGPNGEEYRREMAAKRARKAQRKRAFLETPKGQAFQRKREEKRAARKEKRRAKYQLAIEKKTKRRNAHLARMNNAGNKAKQLNN